MKKSFYCLIVLLPALVIGLGGCATPGPKYLDLAYTRTGPANTAAGRIGLARYRDKRPGTPKGEVGYRVLANNARETFVVSEMDLAAAMTRITRSHLEQGGFSVSLHPQWPRTAKGVTGISKAFTHVLAADINRFECKARKKGAVTDMVLAIDLTLYLGTPNTRQLKTIPIALNLERTELNFTRKKVEQFVNQALEEILVKALPFS